MQVEFQSFTEFWPYYVSQHSKALTRIFHFIGTAGTIALLIAAFVYDSVFAVLIPLSGYGLAWFSHFFIEHNKPATFRYPLWSLVGDCKMFVLMLCGRMNQEIVRCVRPK